MAIKDVDRGFKRLLKDLKKVGGSGFGSKGPRVTVGARGERNSTIAHVHEFGAPSVNIPERSHFRSAFDENRKRYGKIVQDAMGKLVDGKATPDAVLTVVGAAYRSDVVKKIRSNLPPTVSPATQKRKDALGQGSTSLIATGEYIGSIRAVVVKK